MCMGSSPSVPATPEVQAAPQEQDAAVVDARDEETRRRRAAIRAWKTTSTSETMLPKHGCTGLDSGLKKPRLMVLLVLISTDFTWRENNV